MENYIIQKSSTQPNGWVLTDKKHGIVVTFEDGLYNDTQKVTMLEDVPIHYTPEDLAVFMQDMGAWAVRHHSSKCFKQPYGIEYSEDDNTCFLYRRKSPRWRLEIQDDVDKNNLASSLKKAAEWLTKR